MSDSAAGPAYDLAVFVGRFQPFHKGHLKVVEQALETARHVLVIVGSAEAARRADLLPFTADERREMILASLGEADRERVTIRTIPDLSDLDAWRQAVERDAEAVAAEQGLGDAPRITLIGCSKDRSSYYLKAFPRWGSVDVPVFDDLSATPGRRAFFDADPAVADAWLKGAARRDLPGPVVDWLTAFRAGPFHAPLVEELAWADRYRQTWAAAPYPPIFVTADAVVLRGDQVLLIQRKSHPGKGLWALPGGFVEQDEFVLDAAIRELAEETALAVPGDALRRAAGPTRIHDAPFRDMRGRVITHATLFRLDAAGDAPVATAADDAADARWTPLAEVRRDEMFGDHLSIIHGLLRAEAATRGEG